MVEFAPIDFNANPKVRPICLPSNLTETYAGKTGVVVGWGEEGEWCRDGVERGR